MSGILNITVEESSLLAKFKRVVENFLLLVDI